MPTMYEKLGELLSESLEKGEVLQFTEEDKFTEEKFSIYENNILEKNNNVSEQQKTENRNADSKDNIDEASEKLRQNLKKKAKRTSGLKNGKGIVYKKLSPELERAFRTLDISVSADIEDVKKAYKEKLKYFHPDRHQDNEILQKVATNKTRQIVEAYNLLMNYFENK